MIAIWIFEFTTRTSRDFILPGQQCVVNWAFSSWYKTNLWKLLSICSVYASVSALLQILNIFLPFLWRIRTFSYKKTAEYWNIFLLVSIWPLTVGSMPCFTVNFKMDVSIDDLSLIVASLIDSIFYANMHLKLNILHVEKTVKKVRLKM